MSFIPVVLLLFVSLLMKLLFALLRGLGRSIAVKAQSDRKSPFEYLILCCKSIFVF